MIIPFEEIIKITGQPNGIWSLGSHLGEELPEFLKYGISNIIFVEGNPHLIPALKMNVGPNYYVFQAILSDKDDENVDFRLIYSDDLTNKGCSSLYPLAKHAKLYPMIKERAVLKLKTTKLDTLAQRVENPEKYDLISMDLQGAELKVLQGATDTLKHVKAIVTEFSTIELYKGQVIFDELAEFLSKIGFKLAIKRFIDDSRFPDPVWGDSLWIK